MKYAKGSRVKVVGPLQWEGATGTVTDRYHNSYLVKIAQPAQIYFYEHELAPHDGPASVTYASGAVREPVMDVRYELISPYALERLARTLAKGARKYDNRNWEKGMPFGDTLNHIYQHLHLWLRRDKSIEDGKEVDHLANAMFGLMALMHYERTGVGIDDRPVWTDNEPSDNV